MTAPARPTAPTGAPAYMSELLMRAAQLLQVHFPTAGPLPFTLYVDGRRFEYLARMEWPLNSEDSCLGPVVYVLSSTSGDMVCRSTAGEPFALHPTEWSIDGDIDEAARNRWEQSQHIGARRS